MQILSWNTTLAETFSWRKLETSTLSKGNEIQIRIGWKNIFCDGFMYEFLFFLILQLKIKSLWVHLHNYSKILHHEEYHIQQKDNLKSAWALRVDWWKRNINVAGRCLIMLFNLFIFILLIVSECTVWWPAGPKFEGRRGQMCCVKMWPGCGKLNQCCLMLSEAKCTFLFSMLVFHNIYWNWDKLWCFCCCPWAERVWTLQDCKHKNIVWFSLIQNILSSAW